MYAEVLEPPLSKVRRIKRRDPPLGLESPLDGSLAGTQSVEVILTREQAGKYLSPPVGRKQVARYLLIAAKFLPDFKNFLDLQTGRLNKHVHLTVYHLPALQKIRTKAREMPLTMVRTYVKDNRNEFINHA